MLNGAGVGDPEGLNAMVAEPTEPGVIVAEVPWSIGPATKLAAGVNILRRPLGPAVR
jgi:hypothetical protein